VNTTPSLTDVLPAGASVLIDTSVALAYLTGTEAISPLAVELFDRCLATGRNPGAMSAVSVTELLVRPFRAGSSAVSTIEGFLRHFAALRIEPVEYATAREAARIRAVSALSAPDALIVASHLVGETDVLVTNDGSWPTRLQGAGLDTAIIVVGDLMSGATVPRRDRRHV
jgi:predicted nucleic acid-binding protein